MSIMRRQRGDAVITHHAGMLGFTRDYLDEIPQGRVHWGAAVDLNMATHEAAINEIAMNYQAVAARVQMSITKFDDVFEPGLVSYVGALSMMNHLCNIWHLHNANAGNFNTAIENIRGLRGAQINKRAGNLDIPYIPNAMALVGEPTLLTVSVRNSLPWIKYFVKVMEVSAYAQFLDERMADRLITSKGLRANVETQCTQRFLKVLGWAQGTPIG